MMRPTGDVLSFGPFRLAIGERSLTRHGTAVELGGRTLDTLVALVSRPNEIVSKRTLIAQIWPDVTVEEGTLRYHIANLRKALGDGEHGARYIATVAGRGYCFVAPIARSRDNHVEEPVAADLPGGNLPARLSRMVGRGDDALILAHQLAAARFVTITGPGGVGKTTLAVAVAHELIAEFSGAVLFVDFGALTDPGMIAASVASMLGLPVQSDDPTPNLIAHLRSRRILLILDTCEHLIEAAASFIARILEEAPPVHVLATSREALRAEGEHIHRLGGLACPPEDDGLTASQAKTFPAVQLFLERAAATGAHLNFDDTNAAIVAGICRKLDGVPLAIELAAGRAEAYGLGQLPALLDRRLNLLWQGRRTAPPRQRTLQATLDWSYELLSETERTVLRRLAIFVGYFSIDAALEVVTSASLNQALALSAVDSLMAKSLVATRQVGATTRYHLLDTMRSYALAIAIEEPDLAARHARYHRRWLEQIRADLPALSNAAARMPLLVGLNDVRGALEWCFGPEGDPEIGVGLAAAAAPVFLSLSLITDCQRWSRRAIHAIDESLRGSGEEMLLQAALGVALLFTREDANTAGAVLTRSLAIAEARGDLPNQIYLHGSLHLFHTRIGEYARALRHAETISALSATNHDPIAQAIAHALSGFSLQLAGDLRDARAQLEEALRQRDMCPAGHEAPPVLAPIAALILSSATSILARTMWLQGNCHEAERCSRRSVAEATSAELPLTLMGALTWAISLLLWIGDLDAAQEHIDHMASHAQSSSLGLYGAVSQGFHGELTLQRGDAQTGVESLKSAVKALHQARYNVLVTPFNISLAQGLAALGRLGESYELLEETIRAVEANGDLLYMPELLRVKGGILSAMPEMRHDDAELCLRRSLEWSRRQGARAWELRTGIDLAALLANREEGDSARRLLRPIVEQFAAGSRTADLKAAEQLLARLH
jgi:predicted ATPase/DNA-binding winged helix-turn-helix (wHTH) protein